MAAAREVSKRQEESEETLPLREVAPPKNEETSRVIKLRKELGLIDGIGMIMGVVIGSGIFISPSGVMKYSGSVGMSLTIWMVSGVISIIGALCYAELGTMIPKSGGDYSYLLAIFGELPAFLYMWVIVVIILPTRNVIIALTFANYIILPAFPNCTSAPQAAVKLVAATVICFLAWVNCTNVRVATKIQDIFTVAKVFALAVIIGAGMYWISYGRVSNFQKAFDGTNWDISTLSTAFYQGLFSYAGWNYLNYIVEELNNPYTNLPLAIVISLPTVTAVYVLTNIAYFAVLTPDEVLSSSAVAVTFGNRTLGPMAWIIPVFVACSTFGGLNGGIFASSRLFFVGARQGHLPQALALINVKSLTPKPSIIFLNAMTLAMLIFSDIISLINYISFSESIFTLMAVTGLLWLRYKEPNRNRPVKVWLILPVIFFVVCIFLVVLPLTENPVELGIAIAIVLTGIPVFFIFIYWKTKPKWFQDAVNSLVIWVQIMTLGLPAEKE